MSQTRELSAKSLFEQLQDSLMLVWEHGEKGGLRGVQPAVTQGPRSSLAGFLNLVHPNDIQIFGSEEIAYLDSLDSRKRWETIAEIVGNKPVALVIADGLVTPDDLAESAEEVDLPIWSSIRPGVDLANRLQHFLSRALAESKTVHGVFMEVFSIGVLITGDSGSGKSELALELITRGHRLIADDAPQMKLATPEIVDGTCPPVLQDCLEVRGLGILNVRAMFGDSAVKPSKYLKLVVHLNVMGMDEVSAADEDSDRLRGDNSFMDMLGIQIPVIAVPVAPGRNLAVIVEAAVRNHSLKLRGYDAPKEFIERQRAQMNEAENQEQ
jgi:HPr kinase/phosphorylase